MNCSFMRFLSLLMSVTIYLQANAQFRSSKPVLDTAAVNHWTRLSNPAIGASGSYVGYTSSEGYGKNTKLILKSIEANSRRQWKVEIPGVWDYVINPKESHAVAIAEGNRLVIQKLGGGEALWIAGVKEFRVLKTRKSEFVVYLTMKNELVFIEFDGRRRATVKNVFALSMNHDGTSVCVVRKAGEHNSVELYKTDGSEKNVGVFNEVNSVIWRKDNKFLAFVATTEKGRAVYEYHLDSEKLDMVPMEAKNAASIQVLERYTDDGKYLLARRSAPGKPKPEGKIVQVWNYADRRLKSEELRRSAKGGYAVALDVSAGNVIELENDSLSLSNLVVDHNGFVLQSHPIAQAETHWRPEPAVRSFIKYPSSEDLKELPLIPRALSPDGKFVVGNDLGHSQFIAYELKTGNTVSVGRASLSRSLAKDTVAGIDNGLRSFAGWTDDHDLLLYDDYDIWKIDLSDASKGVCLTNGYGRASNIEFRFALRKDPSIMHPQEMLLLSAFDNRSKRNGFFQMTASNGNPIALHMDDRLFNAPGNELLPDHFPLKAANAKVWLLRSERADESENFYTTSDFKNFRLVSENFPERDYNWLTTELLHFKQKDGRANSAVVYKPENFDPTRKYPVIITYYEKMTDRLNTMIAPELSQDHINIPWFVSRGYIVCTPDIFYEGGLPGESALNAVNALTDSLVLLPYIDSDNIAVHGHSFGGFETNYIIAHTNRFKAAMSASSICDLVGDYNGVWPDGISRQQSYEFGQVSMKYTLWERPDLYIKNSPIFDVPAIQTPLLMMNNRLDGASKFDQAIEFFTALRRLGKKVWMLEYEGGHHSLVDPVHTLDYTRKLEDFFGYYLRGQPMPDWMKPQEK